MSKTEKKLAKYVSKIAKKTVWYTVGKSCNPLGGEKDIPDGVMKWCEKEKKGQLSQNMKTMDIG